MFPNDPHWRRPKNGERVAYDEEGCKLELIQGRHQWVAFLCNENIGSWPTMRQAMARALEIARSRPTPFLWKRS